MGDLIGFLLGTRRVVIPEGSTWEFKFAAPISPVWYVLAGLVITAGVIALYWRESVPLTLRQRLTFVALRTVVVTVILVMLAEPGISVSTTSRRLASVAVLIDTSRSMSVNDAYTKDEALRTHASRAAGLVEEDPASGSPAAPGGDRRDLLPEMSRIEIVQAALERTHRQFLARLAEQFGVALYTFDSDARLAAATSDLPDKSKKDNAPADLDKPPVLKATGSATDIGTAVRAALRDARAARRSLAALVLISDGRATAGTESPARVANYARQHGVPLFSVAVGDPYPPSDIRIASVLANKTAFVDDPTQVSFVLKSAGFEGQRVQVDLIEGERVLKTTSLAIPGGNRQQRGTFTFRPRRPGKHTYTVRARPLPGELIEANNAADVLLQVIKEKIKVLYIEGEPRWDYRFLKNALIRDQSLLASCLLATAEYGFIQEGNLPIDHFPSTPQELFKYNVVILGDVDPTIFTTRQMNLIKDFVERLGGGVVFIAGEHYLPRAYRNTPLAKMIPVICPSDRYAGVNKAPRGLTNPFRPALTEAGKEHPITLLANDPLANQRLWSILPGMYWFFPALRAKPGTATLLVHPTQSRGGKPVPLLVAGFYGAGRTVFAGFDETWRWRYGCENRHFYRFWGQIIRYVRAGRQAGPARRFSLTTYKPEYREGEMVTIRARLLDRSYRPLVLEHAEALLVLPGGREMGVTLQPVEPGIYEGQVRASVVGTHQVKLSRPSPSRLPGGVSCAFLVKRADLEFRDTRADYAALERMAQSTGGKLFYLDELPRLAEALRAQRRIKVERAQLPLWDAPIFFFIFLGAICAEWIYRKRQRLL